MATEGDDGRVFIAWSGRRSNDLAKFLHGWLKQVNHETQPWMSEVDIGKGEQWNATLASELGRARFGLLCVTPENRDSTWLHFEAGALAKTVPGQDDATASGRVSPVLLDVVNTELSGPLSAFQSTHVTAREDVWRLIRDINARALVRPLDQAVLERSFEKWWPDLEGKLADLTPSSINSEPTEPDTSEVLLALTREQQRQLDRIEVAIEQRIASPYRVTMGGQPVSINWSNAQPPAQEGAYRVTQSVGGWESFEPAKWAVPQWPSEWQISNALADVVGSVHRVDSVGDGRYHARVSRIERWPDALALSASWGATSISVTIKTDQDDAYVLGKPLPRPGPGEDDSEPTTG